METNSNTFYRNNYILWVGVSCSIAWTQLAKTYTCVWVGVWVSLCEKLPTIIALSKEKYFCSTGPYKIHIQPEQAGILGWMFTSGGVDTSSNVILAFLTVLESFSSLCEFFLLINIFWIIFIMLFCCLFCCHYIYIYFFFFFFFFLIFQVRCCKYYLVVDIHKVFT